MSQLAGDSRRWFSHQPNIVGRGLVAGYSARFWGLVVALGVITGIAGALLMTLLYAVQHLAWGYHSGTFLAGVQAAPSWRHIVVLLAAALIVGAAALVLERFSVSGGGEISESLWLRGARLATIPSLARGVLSIVTVGMGSSLGR